MAFRNAIRSGTPADWLVVGLGNPGAEYATTRHNVGADAVALLAERNGERLKVGKERALIAEVRIGAATGPTQQRIVLAFPQTFMNLSGESVHLLMQRHSVTDPARVVVVHDELDLPVGRVKLKLGGGTGGHNGLKSVQTHLGSQGFARIRIGIGRPPGQQSSADFVLKRPGKAERALIDVAIEIAADAVETIVTSGFDRAMNSINTEPAL
jgi:peptidyl-tRNA hydrolase, PTH1 family